MVGKGREVRRSGENDVIRCGFMYMSALVQQSPTSTLTFHLVSGKTECALITFSATGLLTVLSHGMSRYAPYTHNMCSVGLYDTYTEYPALPAKGHVMPLR